MLYSFAFLRLPPEIPCGGKVGAGLQQQRFPGLYQRNAPHGFNFTATRGTPLGESGSRKGLSGLLPNHIFPKFPVYRKNRIFKELDVTAPALYSLGMDPVVLLASFGSVGALQPDLLVQ